MEKNLNEEDTDLLANAASAGDCTGLIPAGECREEELERYQELYRFGAPGGDGTLGGDETSGGDKV